MSKSQAARYRVSSARQGQSGPGHEARRAAVSTFVHNRSTLKEFVEVESGKVNNRPQLVATILNVTIHVPERNGVQGGKPDRFFNQLELALVQLLDFIYLWGPPFPAEAGRVRA